MSRDKLRAAFKVIRQTEEFRLVIPRGKESCFGTVKHNMPHEFYAFHEESRMVLVGHFKYGLKWARVVEDFVEPIEDIMLAESQRQYSWPYAEDSIIVGSRIITTEEILADGSDFLKEFVIFNLNIFT